MSESYQSPVYCYDDNTHGIGMDLAKTLHTYKECVITNDNCVAEAAPLQNCPFNFARTSLWS